MSGPDDVTTAQLLAIVKPVERLMAECQAMEKEVQGLVADALDAGMCPRAIEFGMILAHRLGRNADRKRPLRLSDLLRGGFLLPGS